jgi:cell division protein ZapA
MSQINVMVGGRSYTLSCREGEEARLQRLAAHVNKKAEDLSSTLGQMSEPRMLLMSALLVADELFDQKDRAARNAGSSVDVGAATGAMNAVAERLEHIAARL